MAIDHLLDHSLPPKTLATGPPDSPSPSDVHDQKVKAGRRAPYEDEAMLKVGLAWHFLEYDKNPAWTEMEATARRLKKGLWAQPNPIPPWEFRKRKKKK